MSEARKPEIHTAKEREEVVFSGERIEVVHQRRELDGKEVVFEWGQRPPGVRILAENEAGEILLTREYRHELDDYDYRLPGGKVADSLAEWHQQIESGEEEQAAYAKAIAEGKEEAGLEIEELELIEVVPDGATFKWDLHYYRATKFAIGEQTLEHGEDITTGWYPKSEVRDMLRAKKIREGRTVYILAPVVIE